MRRSSTKATSRQRNILFITVDQQRYDALGLNGGLVARTPFLDALGRDGVNYRRAHVQNVVCMPSRSTMLTGQYPQTHGVIANGISLPTDAPSVVDYLRLAGYHTALIGKAHFDPHLDLALRFYENRCAAEGHSHPWHGFEHLELATHGPVGGHHYAEWLWREHADSLDGFAGVLTGLGGGDTGAPEVSRNPISRENYHTDWVARRTMQWIRERPASEPWFCWMSFPDPHHPFDPPADEVKKRVRWQDLDLPKRYLNRSEAIAVLSQKPRHWLDWYEGRFRNPEGGTINFVPSQAPSDQIREMNAMIHVENELVDEACGEVLKLLTKLGLDQRTDVFYTSDHGDLQGDYGLMFKGPYHVDSLLRVPLIWRPAPCASIATAEIDAPVGHVDLAATFCQAAGLEVPEWIEGRALPTEAKDGRDSITTTFDSQFAAVGMHLRTIFHAGFLCTAYAPRTYDEGGRFRFFWSIWGKGSTVPTYNGSEGELYNLRDDPDQRVNLWNDPARSELRKMLVSMMNEAIPQSRSPLEVSAPT